MLSAGVRLLSWGLAAAFLALSSSRAAACVANYGAPLQVYAALSSHLEATGGAPFLASSGGGERSVVRVCVGKEWYRFPTHMFLPSFARLGFVRSGFTGLLPQHFSSAANATALTPAGFNDQNRADESAYVGPGPAAREESLCHYMVDLELPQQREKRYSEHPGQWRELAAVPFLDAERSPSLTRALYVPFLSARRNSVAQYKVFERRQAAPRGEARAE